MKKNVLTAAILSLALTASIGGTTANAASVNQNTAGTDNPGTQISFDYKNDPTYTVTIPDSLTLTKEGTPMNIVAEDVKNLDNQKISVTIAGTDKYRHQMLLEGKTDTGKNASLRYQMIKSDDTVIETKGNSIDGTEIASFTADGTETLIVKPVLQGSSSIIKGVQYTGNITYGIGLVDVEE